MSRPPKKIHRKRTNLTLPPNVRDFARLLCAEKDTSLSELVTDLLTREVEAAAAEDPAFARSVEQVTAAARRRLKSLQ